jgi:hypothetical protein
MSGKGNVINDDPVYGQDQIEGERPEEGKNIELDWFIFSFLDISAISAQILRAVRPAEGNGCGCGCGCGF